MKSSDLLDSKNELDELIHQLTTLKKNQDFLEKEKMRWLQKNTLLNNEHYRISEKINHLKTQRDNKNKDIQILKKRRKKIKKILNERYDEINNYRQEILKLQNDMPQYKEEIKELINENEWKIQTTPLSLEEEKKMIKKIQILEKDLHTDNQIKKIKKKVMKLEAEIESLKIKVDSVHSQILEHSKRSQEYHEKYIELLEKSKLTENTSNTSLIELVKIEKDLNRNRSQHAVLTKQINEVEQKIIMEEKKRQQQKIKKKRTEIEEIAQYKLKKKKKLSFGEFKILMEEDDY